MRAKHPKPIEEAPDPDPDVQDVDWNEDQAHSLTHLGRQMRSVVEVPDNGCQGAEHQVLRHVDEGKDCSEIPRVEPCSSHPDHLKS